jgi:hypothetical protein
LAHLHHPQRAVMSNSAVDDYEEGFAIFIRGRSTQAWDANSSESFIS